MKLKFETIFKKLQKIILKTKRHVNNKPNRSHSALGVITSS